jgi:hypothetical protein
MFYSFLRKQHQEAIKQRQNGAWLRRRKSVRKKGAQGKKPDSLRGGGADINLVLFAASISRPNLQKQRNALDL